MHKFAVSSLERKFASLCHKGNLKSIQNLLNSNIRIVPYYENERDKLDTCVNIGFWRASEQGHLELAQFLLQSPSNIRGDQMAKLSKSTFEFFLYHNYLKGLKCLLSLEINNGRYNPDLQIDGDAYFIRACKQGYLDMAKWLLSEADHHSIVINQDRKSNLMDRAFKLVCTPSGAWHNQILEWLIDSNQISSECVTNTLGKCILPPHVKTKKFLKFVFDNCCYLQLNFLANDVNNESHGQSENENENECYKEYKKEEKINLTKLLQNENIENYLLSDIWNLIFSY